jgi:hypothetical protein
LLRSLFRFGILGRAVSKAFRPRRTIAVPETIVVGIGQVRAGFVGGLARMKSFGNVAKVWFA